ncbi:hypothetical protein ACWCV2_22740 [Streptomyces pseudogriseolus]
MDRATAALWAAFITASAAILVGGLAFYSAVRVARRTAMVQREQAFWNSRRDTYVSVMHAFGKIDRARVECLLAYRKGEFSDSSLIEKLTDASYEFEAARLAMLLEAPHDPVIAAALKTANRKQQAVLHLYMAWNSAGSEGDDKARDVTYWDLEEQAVQRKLAAARNSLFIAMRNDLHREVGGDFVHGPLRFRLAGGRKRRQPPVPPLPDDDD